MARHYISSAQKKGTRLHGIRSSGEPLSLEEKNCLFSVAAQGLVAGMLQGEVEIQSQDIQLDLQTERGDAIRISERVSCNPQFQKMWAETSCGSMLKALARRALQR